MKLRQYKKTGLIVLFLSVCVPFLGGCFSMYKEGNLNTNHLQVKEEKFFEQIEAAKADDVYIYNLAKYYSRHGDGQIDLSVVYNPKSKSATAMHAGNELSRLVEAMRKNGLRDVNANILPVQGSDVMQVIVSFTSYNALAPKDCGTLLPGLVGRMEIDNNPDYRLGCSIETVFARQIARPKDLKGRDQSDLTTDGRRSSNVIELHRTGIPNEPLGGESSTGE